jgi:hypothetical protein
MGNAPKRFSATLLDLLPKISIMRNPAILSLSPSRPVGAVVF